jgi:hypothetical protein
MQVYSPIQELIIALNVAKCDRQTPNSKINRKCPCRQRLLVARPKIKVTMAIDDRCSSCYLLHARHQLHSRIIHLPLDASRQTTSGSLDTAHIAIV